MDYYDLLIRRSRQAQPSSLVVDLPMDTQSPAYDNLGNAITYVGSPNATTFGGMTCTEFSGSQGLYVADPPNAPTGDHPFSQSIWVNIKDSTADMGLAGLGSSPNTKTWAFIKCQNKKVGAGGWFMDYNPNVTLTVGTWYHLVQTYNGEQWDFYVDGEHVYTSTTYTPELGDTSYRVSAGCHYGDRNWAYGYLKAYRAYDKALSLEEIQDLYHEFDQSDSSSSGSDISDSSSSGGGLDPSLVFYLPFTESATADVAGGRTMQVTGTVSLTTIDGIPCANVGGGNKLFTDVLAGLNGNLPTGNESWTVMCFGNVSSPGGANNLYALGTNTGRKCILQGPKGGYPIYNNYNPDHEPRTPAWTANTWVHTAATYDGDTKTLKGYFNGSPNGSWSLGDQGLNVTLGGVHIGEFGGYRASASYVASVRIYNRVLSDSEIADLAGEFN